MHPHGIGAKNAFEVTKTSLQGEAQKAIFSDKFQKFCKSVRNLNASSAIDPIIIDKWTYKNLL